MISKTITTMKSTPPTTACLALLLLISSMDGVEGSDGVSLSDALLKYHQKPACTPDQNEIIDRCLQPIIEYTTNMQSDGHATMLAFDGLAVFDKLCQIFQTFTLCSSGVNCRNPGAGAMEASYGYMCGEGYKFFAEHVGCFMKIELDESYKKCRDSANQGINSLQAKAAAEGTSTASSSDTSTPSSNPTTPFNTQSEYFDHLCSLMQDYLSCSKGIIIQHCGRMAWELVAKDYLSCSKGIIIQHCGPMAWELVAKVSDDSLQISIPSCSLTDFLKA